MAYRDVISPVHPNIVDGRHMRCAPAGCRNSPPHPPRCCFCGLPSDLSLLPAYSCTTSHGTPGRGYPLRTPPSLCAKDHLLVGDRRLLGSRPGLKAAWPTGGGPTTIPLTGRIYALPAGYPNLLGADDRDRAFLGYGPNSSRLARYQRRLDPDGVFSAVPALGES